MLNFGTLSTKGKPLLKYNNKLYSKTKFASNEDGEIHKCYWSCVNVGRGCTAKVRYSIDQHLAGANHDGMSAGIIDIVASDHDDEYCSTNADDIIKINARNDILVKATEG